MKINATTLVILIAICFFLMQCDYFAMDIKYRALLYNNSAHSINGYAAIPYRDSRMYPMYPDFSLPMTSQYVQKVSTGRKESIYYNSASWDQIFRDLPADTLSIYVFHSDTLTKYPWEEIRNRYNILARYDLSLQDLTVLDFKVPYPPDQRMQDMKVFP
jgi:hypothetical protein